MTLAMANRNGLLRASEYGFADVKAGIKVSPQTLFEIGSLSKSFVAMAVLQLAEEGKVNIKSRCQLFAVAKNRIEVFAFYVHHLLSHTSGLSGIPLLNRAAGTTLRTEFRAGVPLGLFKHRLRLARILD